jgi:hypothetical protein
MVPPVSATDNAAPAANESAHLKETVLLPANAPMPKPTLATAPPNLGPKPDQGVSQLPKRVQMPKPKP